jgi:hypothetical protein
MRIKIALTVILLWCTGPLVYAGDRIQQVVFLGSFSNLKFTEEHQYGAEVRLWRQGPDLFGFFSYAAGLRGDTPTGLLDHVKYDPETGKLSFQAKLTVGLHSCKLHPSVPSRDLFTFQGILAHSSISGSLRQWDGLHPEKQPEAEKVVLKKMDKAILGRTGYQSRSQWDKEAREMLKRLGPKW